MFEPAGREVGRQGQSRNRHGASRYPIQHSLRCGIMRHVRRAQHVLHDSVNVWFGGRALDVAWKSCLRFNGLSKPDVCSNRAIIR